MTGGTGFVPPPYPYDRLGRVARLAGSHPGGLVDLSVGTPCDDPPGAVVAALASSGTERGYPASVGSARYREAARGWMARRLGVEVPDEAIAACIGTKELVAGLPHWLRLRHPGRDTVLHPAIAYPTYAMGAVLAGCRAVAVPLAGDGTGRLDLDAVEESDAERALALWVNSPANPTGALDDLAAAAAWGRARDVVVLSDECYTELTWEGPGRTILEHGLEGVLAVHSLSKRSNLAGLRAGFYAGDPDLVGYLGELRKHAGMMVPGPVQVAGARAWEDDDHVFVQRDRYLGRLEMFAEVLRGVGLEVARPAGTFYLWVALPGGPPPALPGAPAPALPGGPPPALPGGLAWIWAEALATVGGVLVSPGEFYGPDGAGHLRVAMVAPLDRLELVARRLSAWPGVAGGGLTGRHAGGLPRDR